jgi:hypothetical protein
MWQQNDTPFLPQDIYNLYAQFQRERLQGLAVTDALIKHLEQNNILFTIKPDKENHTRHLFIVVIAPISMLWVYRETRALA